MIVLVPLFIVALFLLFAVYAVTDLDELMREQVLLDELWLDDGGVTERGSTRDIQPATDPQASGHIERREDKRAPASRSVTSTVEVPDGR